MFMPYISLSTSLSKLGCLWFYVQQCPVPARSICTKHLCLFKDLYPTALLCN
jgi:hypothetical protein